jgi:hypothetical protein
MKTPREYRVSLESHLPEVEGEMGELTDAFIEARYSRHPVDAADVQSIKEDWHKVEHSLRMLKRARSASGEPDEDDG